MRHLLFDRGTVVLRDADEGDPGVSSESTIRSAPIETPWLTLDERVGWLRGPAFKHREIADGLLASGLMLEDQVLELPPKRASWSPVELRPHQEAAFTAWLAQGRQGVVVLPTGTGKTHVAMRAASEARGVVILVPTRALLEQWVTNLRRYCALPAARFGDGRHEVGPLTVMTFESAFRSMMMVGSRFELLVVDEAHHFGSGARAEAIETCAAPQRLGLTATPPEPEARERLAELIGPVCHEQGLSELSDQLADFDLVVVGVVLSPEERLDYEREMAAFRAVYRAFERVPFSMSSS